MEDSGLYEMARVETSGRVAAAREEADLEQILDWIAALAERDLSANVAVEDAETALGRFESAEAWASLAS